MTHSSCILTPSKNRYIQLHEWQVKFCEENHCAAMLLSFFIAWHDWKIMHDAYYKRCNDIAEMHGDNRSHNEDAYLFFSTEALIEGLMGVYGKKAINAGIELLTSLKVITIHANPNPRYRFDKTRYFKFYPDVCNQWIKKFYFASPISREDFSNDCSLEKTDLNPVSTDRVKRNDREAPKDLPSCQKIPPSAPRHLAITDTTNNTTKKYSPTARDGNLDVLEDKTESVIEALVAKGMLRKRFYPDALVDITRLQQLGASARHFEKAYDIAENHTQQGNFGVKYLIPIVEELLTNPKTSAYFNKAPPDMLYENDFSKGLDWMGDLI